MAFTLAFRRLALRTSAYQQQAPILALKQQQRWKFAYAFGFRETCSLVPSHKRDSEKTAYKQQGRLLSTSIAAQAASTGLAPESGISRSLHNAGNKFVLRFNSPAGIPESAAPQAPGGIFHIDNGPFDTEEKKKVFCEILAQAVFNFLSIGACAMATIHCAGNSLATTLTVMASHFVILPIVIFAFGPVSGAHFNPMITTVMVLTGLLRATTGLGYVVAQCFGGILGAATWWNLLPAASRNLSMIGIQAAPADHSLAQIFGGEVAAAFFFVLALFGMVVDKRGWGKLGPFAVATIVCLNMWIFGPISSFCMNPARALGPAVVSGFWENHWIWWTAPFVGGISAGAIYKNLFMEKGPEILANGILAAAKRAPHLHFDSWLRPQPPQLLDSVLILSFFGHHHSSARPTLAHLDTLSRLYPEDRVSFLGIGSGDQRHISSLIDEVDPSFGIALDSAAESRRSYQDVVGGDDAPASVVVNRLGQIVWSGSPMSSSLERAVENELLQAADPNTLLGKLASKTA